jgi:hypothetical protein
MRRVVIRYSQTSAPRSALSPRIGASLRCPGGIAKLCACTAGEGKRTSGEGVVTPQCTAFLIRRVPTAIRVVVVQRPCPIVRTPDTLVKEVVPPLAIAKKTVGADIVLACIRHHIRSHMHLNLSLAVPIGSDCAVEIPQIWCCFQNTSQSMGRIENREVTGRPCGEHMLFDCAFIGDPDESLTMMC